METIAIVSSVFLVLSIALNALQWHLAAAAAKKPAAPPKPDLTAQDLLHDLTKHGQAVLKVEVIDMSNILLRSPRR